MVLEPNLESTEGLDGQRAESKGNGILPKPSQNSSPRIPARTPIEVLECIFEWIVTRKEDDDPFMGFTEGTYNFLLVCRRWNDIGSRNPRLWRFWGPTLRKWDGEMGRNRAGAVPIDLVLNRDAGDSKELGAALQDALKKRALNLIRSIHFRGREDPDPLGSIISLLTSDGAGAQVESIIFSGKTIPEELPKFFSRSRLPWLRCLQIEGSLAAPSWDSLVTSETTRLTSLSLQFVQTPPLSIGSQIISILAANPNLQELELCGLFLDKVKDSDIRVPLDHLKRLALYGNFYSLFRLLKQLKLPATLDSTTLTMYDPMVADTANPMAADIIVMLGPFMTGLFERDVRFKNPLDVFTDSNHGAHIVIDVSLQESEYVWSKVIGFSIVFTTRPPDGLLRQWTVGLMRFIPQERVERLGIEHTPEVPDQPFVEMPNLKILYLQNVTLSDGFLQADSGGPHAGRTLLPSLECLYLIDVTLSQGGSWQPLISFLKDRTADDRSSELRECSASDMPDEIREVVRSLIKV